MKTTCKECNGLGDYPEAGTFSKRVRCGACHGTGNAVSSLLLQLASADPREWHKASRELLYTHHYHPSLKTDAELMSNPGIGPAVVKRIRATYGPDGQGQVGNLTPKQREAVRKYLKRYPCDTRWSHLRPKTSLAPRHDIVVGSQVYALRNPLFGFEPMKVTLEMAKGRETSTRFMCFHPSLGSVLFWDFELEPVTEARAKKLAKLKAALKKLDRQREALKFEVFGTWTQGV